jgi:MoaA/NifB/PqqE/SkfB family radical SAM enzyme
MNRICTLPFSILNCVNDILYPCCSGWLKPEVKSIIKSHTASDIWFKDFKVFRDSILDGTYKYCKNDCPMRLDMRDSTIPPYDKLPDNIKYELDKPNGFNAYPFELTLSYDVTCNLTCKGCRKSILKTPQPDINKFDAYYSELIDNATTLRISGDGDAFASPYYFNLLKSDLTIRCKKLKDIKLMTNGILFDEYHFNQIHENNKKLISTILISIDATTQDTYKKFRGGDFNKLCKNLKYIKSLKDKYGWFIYSAYTVSSINFIEMPDFVDFAFDNGIDMIQYWAMNDWGRGYSKKEYGVDTSSYEFNTAYSETLNRLAKLGDSMQCTMSISPTEITTPMKLDSTLEVHPTEITTPMKLDSTLKINQPYTKNDMHHIPSISTLELDNTFPNVLYAIYCPFYITDDNQGIWIDKWIDNVAKLEQSTPIFYTISYPDTLDIHKYNSHIEKLNKYGVCIKIEPNLHHIDSLKIAHDYLKTYGYSYMVHIEQDVILTSQISNHIINRMVSDNSDYLITDIKGNDYFYNICDIDISIFCININTYDSNNYTIYATSDNIKDNLLSKDHLKYNIGNCDIIPPLLCNLSNKDISTYIEKELNTVYKSTNLQHWIKFHLQELNIENAINPIFIDSARVYPLHAYINEKLSIINGIEKYAKHLKESRRSMTAFNMTSIDDTIKYFGYPPIGPNSANEHIQVDPYYSNGIDIVIISKNQEKSIKEMMFRLRIDIPTANRIFVLDRCSDGSKEMLESYNEFFVERHDAVGFCAGSARNIGLKHTNPEHDVLFLDGDRIPHNLNYERIVQMLYYFNVSMIKNETDTRNWFVNVPSINTQYRNYNNNVWSSAILLRRTAITKISEIVGDGNLFDPTFDGNWGCEDEYLGDVATSLGMLSGGFPSTIYVEGETTVSNTRSPEYMNQVSKRTELKKKLSSSHQDTKSTYMDKADRRSHIENFLKHRERLER